MSTIVLVVMLFLTVASFWIVFKGKKEPSIIEYRSYNSSFNKLLDGRYKNTGHPLQPEEYLKRADNVLKELNLVDNSSKFTDEQSLKTDNIKNNIINARTYNHSFNGVLNERYENDGNTIKYGDFFNKADYILNHF